MPSGDLQPEVALTVRRRCGRQIRPLWRSAETT